ncbi:MAG: transcriptional repressor NrdR [Deltaproteobacteria bacterium]|nr:MAG: transcriptional repressor NrdR [Deltaproteobacteria bacterium]
MRCPVCADTDNKVVDSRLVGDGAEIRRRRECRECGHRFTTRERVEESFPKLVKRDARREAYDRRKLLAGIAKACVKRPVSAEAVERLVERVERRLQETGEQEIDTRVLGERVIEGLAALDAMAAIRFASVFRNFRSAEDYAAFIATLRDIESDAREDD